MGETSSDNELSDWRDEDMDFAKSMIFSHDRVDQRLIDLFKLKRVHLTTG